MEPTDIELVAMAQAAKDDRAFTVLVERHQARLRAFLLRLSGDRSLADDIAQDAFVKAHAALASFRGGGSFRSWLFAIAYREFLQAKRRSKAAARLAAALAAEREPDPAAGVDAGMSLDIRRALSTLDDLERAAILLCDAAGLSHTEAAAALSTPLGSIKTYVARARRKMRDALEGEVSEPQASEKPTLTNGVAYAF